MYDISNRGPLKIGTRGLDRQLDSEIKLRGHDPHQEPYLNFDILRLVCDRIAEIPDVLSFALTCSSLTEDALRRRLRMAPIALYRGELLDKFRAFIFANQQARAPCIYGFTIRTVIYWDLPDIDQPDDLTITYRLLTILKAAVHLQYVYIHTSMSERVINAVVKLPTLRELHILGDLPNYQEPFLKHLAVLKSPLRMIYLSGIDFSETYIPASFLHYRLSHLAPTLESLDLDNFRIDILPSDIKTQFTAVRSLKLQAHFPPDCDLLGVLVQLFPNLDNTLELGPTSGALRDEMIPAFRERSQEAQKRHRWSRLDRLACHAATAYFLALQCPIRRMDIQVHSPTAVHYFTETLRHSHSTHLNLWISFYRGFGALDELFSFEVAGKLTHLVLFVEVGVHHGRRSRLRNRDVLRSNRIVNRLLGSIKHLRLTHLHVVFHYTIYLHGPLGKIAPDADPAGDNPFGDRMDLEVTKTHFVDAMATLEYLFLTTCSQIHTSTSKTRGLIDDRIISHWLASKAWRVVHDGEDLHPSECISESDVGMGSSLELSREAAEKVMDRENLKLSWEEEDAVRNCNTDSTGTSVSWEPPPW